ncbi:MAG: PAS domain-containing sensor histidine kinase [Campylobacterota bacterium]|nr:PAS domain-containing sensor histidine kinase [Campylobacterota bacterium]
MIDITKKSFSYILVTIVVTIVAFVSFVHSTYSYIDTKNKLIHEIEEKAQNTLYSLRDNMSNFIISYSVNEYTNLIQTEMQRHNNFAIVAYDYNMGKILAKESLISGNIRDTQNNIIEYDENNIEHIDALKNCFYKKAENISDDNGNLIGKVVVYISDENMKKELKDIVTLEITVSLAILLFLALSLLFTIRYFILKPISSMIRTLSNTDSTGIPNNPVQTHGSIEVQSLSQTVNNMLNSIKNSREKLDEFNERFRLIMDGVNDGIWDWNIKTGDTYFSTQWKNMLGYEKNDLNNKIEVFFDLIHKDDKKRVEDAITKHFENPEKNIYSLELRMRCKDNSYKWILTRGKASLNSKGEAIRMLGSHTDISHQKQVAQELQEQKNEFETIFNNSKDGIAILDLKTNFLNFNEAYLDMTGYTREELLTKSCIGLSIPEDKEHSKEVLQEVLKKGEIKNFEKSCLTKDGKIISINMSITLLPDKKRLLATTKDMTQLKMVESQAKLASMGEMIGNIAHQWRQPLSVISTSATGLKLQKEYNSLTDDIFYETCDLIDDNAQYLSKTIDDFRDFIKGDESFDNVSIVSALNKTMKMVKPSLSNNYIEAILDIKDDLNIKANENELVQSFINIINNSKDAIKENTPSNDKRYIFISTKKYDDKLTVSIKDNGGGIPTDIINRIFEPYFTTKHQNIGTGIGLTMVHKILEERYKATITVENTTYDYKNETYNGLLKKQTTNAGTTCNI